MIATNKLTNLNSGPQRPRLFGKSVFLSRNLKVLSLFQQLPRNIDSTSIPIRLLTFDFSDHKQLHWPPKARCSKAYKTKQCICTSPYSRLKAIQRNLENYCLTSNSVTVLLQELSSRENIYITFFKSNPYLPNEKRAGDSRLHQIILIRQSIIIEYSL